jgi:hypothetical protein
MKKSRSLPKQVRKLRYLVDQYFVRLTPEWLRYQA